MVKIGQKMVNVVFGWPPTALWIIGTADLIESLNLDALPKGVEVSDGLCLNREGTSDAVTTSDVAYTISDRSVASIPTAQLFPDGFPSDFSILATFRAESQSKAWSLL